MTHKFHKKEDVSLPIWIIMDVFGVMELFKLRRLIVKIVIERANYDGKTK